MRRALLVAVIGIGLACGGEDAVDEAERTIEPVEGEANRPPHVEALSIAPAEPTAEDALSVALRVIDPDRDPLEITLTWYRNGSVYDDTGRQTIDPGEFSRDDTVHVEAEVSDGSEQIALTSERVTIANALPRPDALRITPPEPAAADMLEVELEGTDADGDPVRWSYRWLVDGEPLEGANGKRLAPGRLARGARVSVEVSGNDGIADGEWTASDAVVIGNARPKITSQPVYGLASPGRYVYEVKAEDPDGDQPLRYELAEGPDGMAIDLVSGVVSWQLPPQANGSYPVEIAVSDPHGGRATQRWSLDVSWQDEPEKTPASPQDDAAGSDAAEPATQEAEADAGEADETEAGEDAVDEGEADEDDVEMDESEDDEADF